MDTRQMFLKGFLFVLFSTLLSAYAKAEDFVIDGLYYSTLKENTVQVVKPTSGKYEGDITVPESVIYNDSKYKVTAIGNNAFQGASVTSVTLPLTTITSIGEYAFNDCQGLTEFTLPASITTIGRNAFFFCDKLKHLYVHSTKPSSYNPGTEAFNNINYKGNVCTLHVPTGYTAAYSADANFSKFTQVEEFDPPQIYGLWVSGRRVTSINAPDILGDGVASYDASTTTLTISGDITATGSSNDDYGIFSGIDNLTIQISAPSTITSDTDGMCLYGSPTAATITGSSLLTITTKGNYSIDTGSGHLIIKDAHLNLANRLGGWHGTLTVQSSAIDISTTSTKGAIYDFSDVTLTDCYIDIPDQGVYDTTDKRVEDKNGDVAKTVSIKPGPTPVYYDLYVAGKHVNSYNASDILGNGAVSYDASKNTLSISKSFSATGTGLESDIDNLTVQVTAPATITAAGNGMNFTKNTTIAGSSLLTITSGADAAIFADGANLTVNAAHLSLSGLLKGSSGTLSVQSSTIDVTTTSSSSAISGWDDMTLTDCYIKSPEDCVYDTNDKEVEDEFGLEVKTLSIVPGSAPVKYDLYVAGTQVTSVNASDILGNGVASYNVSTNTLTIGGTISATGADLEGYGISSSLEGLTVQVKAPTTITASISGIHFSKNATISGASLLTINGLNGYAITAYEADVTIKDANLSLAGQLKCDSKGTLTIQSSTVDVTIDGVPAIYNWDALVLTDCCIEIPDQGVYDSTNKWIVDEYGNSSSRVKIDLIKLANELAFSETSATATFGQSFAGPLLANPNSLVVTYTSSNTEVATVDGKTGVVTPVSVGEATITASFAGDKTYKAGQVSYELTVAPMTVSAPTIILSNTSFVYDGEPKEPTLTVKVGSTVIPDKEYSVTYTDNIEVGTATVTITDKEGGNYDVSGYTTFAITSADGSLEPPSGISGLFYNNNYQDLISPGSSTTGIMEYSLDGTNYSQAIPMGLDAGEYTIYYRVVAYPGYKDVAPASFKVTIAPQTVSKPTIILSSTMFVYDGQAKEPDVTVMDGEMTIPATEYTVSYSYNVEVGLATVTITDNEGGNYEVMDCSVGFSIVSSELSLDYGDEVVVDGHTLYELSDLVADALKETIEADIVLPIEADSRVTITENGELQFSMGENMIIGLRDLKQNDLVRIGFIGKLYGDGSKLCQKNSPSRRGTRTSGDLELVSDVEYEVLEDGDQTITVALEECECTLMYIKVTRPGDGPIPENETITISAAGQVPYYSAYNLDFTNKPELKAYVATGYDKTKGTIWLTRVKQVPAETGFLLMGDPDDYDIPTIEGVSDVYYKNMFKGTLEGTTLYTTDGDYTNYYLSKGDQGVGFYKVTKAEGVKVGANRCYLPILTEIPANGSTGDTELIKVSAAKQVPYYTSKNLDFTTMEAQGVKAYTATGYNYSTGVIWLTRVKKVPAQTGILVMTDKAGDYNVPTASVQSVYENMFVGSETAQTIYTTETVGDIEYINYYLSNGASGVGFYKVTNDDGVKMGANRCYLPIPKRDVVSSARGKSGESSFCQMVFSDEANDDVIAIPVFGGMNGENDGTTGINVQSSIFNLQSDGVYYNLQGQRIDRPGKGLYIRNGKKVVIK